jgi:hypothetical protein
LLEKWQLSASYKITIPPTQRYWMMVIFGINEKKGRRKAGRDVEGEEKWEKIEVKRKIKM